MKSELVGLRFGLLTITADLGTGKSYLRKVRVLCDCGNEKTVNAGSLKSGLTKSCGCLNLKVLRERSVSHGLTKHPLYSIWLGMKKRCYRVAEKSYPDYGGRGITVCDEWRNDFMAFYNWSIEHEYQKGRELDRERTNGNYEPGNCRFITKKANANNKRNNRSITYNGETLNMAEWSEKLDIPYDNLRYRIKAGWPVEKALTTIAK